MEKFNLKKLVQVRTQIILSGTISLLIFLIYYCFVKKVYPFGDNTILTVDSGQQYIKFFIWAKHVLLNHQSLTYSMYKGWGGEMYSTWAYYLFSPLNILLLFFSNKLMPFGVMLITGIKISLGSMAATYYLLKSKLTNCYFKKYIAPASAFIFGFAYGFCNWSVSNQLNVIWLDVLWIFPLIMLEVERVEDSKKWFSLPLVLLIALAVISNYYMSYMVAVFTFIYALLYMWINSKNKNTRTGVLKYIANGILGIGISAVVVVPTLYQLITGKMAVSDPENSGLQFMKPLINLPTFYNQLGRFNLGFGGISDLPHNQAQLYTGILISILAFMFIFSTGENLRLTKQKFSYLFLFLLMVGGIVWNPIRLFWHAGQPPVWYCFRYMFMWSFLAVVMAYLVWIRLDQYKWFNILPSGIVVIACMLFGLKVVGQDSITLTKTDVWISVSLATVYTIMLIALTTLKNKFNFKIVLTPLLVLLTIPEVTANFFIINNLTSTNLEHEVINPIDYYSRLSSLINTNLNGFARVGRTATATYNDSLNNGLADGYLFNSNTDAPTRNWKYGNGEMGDNNIQAMLSNTPIQANVLNMQYFIDLKSNLSAEQKNLIAVNRYQPLTMLNSAWYRKLNIEGDPNLVNVYQAKYALPLGFLSNRAIEYKPLTKSWVYNQNELLDGLLGSNEFFYTRTPIEVGLKNLRKVPNKQNNRIYQRTNMNQKSTINFSFTPANNDSYFLFIPPVSGVLNYKNDYYGISYNNDLLKNVYHQALETDLASNQKDHKVEVTLEQKGGTVNWNDLGIYHLHDQKVIAGLKKLRQDPLKISYFSNNKIIGDIYADKPGDIFLSIPAVRGWKAILDGKNVPIYQAQQTWMAIRTTTGKHHLELIYHLPFLWLGWLITSLAGSLAVTLAYIDKKKN